MTENYEHIEKIAKIIYAADTIIFLTGAGTSVHSGIPDFRSGGGLWERFNLLEVATIRAFRKAPEKVWNFFPYIIKHEKINNLTWRKKALFAIGFEVIYDSLFGYSHYTQVVGESPIAALSRNIYQIPVFVLGLIAGNKIKKIINWFLTSTEERQMDNTIKQLLQETPVLDIVVNYEMTDTVQQAVEQKGIKVYTSKLTGAGQTAYKNLKKFAKKSKDLADYWEKREKQYELDRQKRADRFKDLTKDR